MINTKKILSITTGLALALSIAIPAFAQTSNSQDSKANENGGWQGQGKSALAPGHLPERKNDKPELIKPSIPGTVTAINGNIITMSARKGIGSTTATVVYTVNATNATVKKGNATSTVSSIVVGDKINVRGTVNGTNITATTIVDNAPGRGPKGDERASSTSPFLGNGEPIIAGTVSAVSATSLTMTNASNVTYTVDITNAKILKGPNRIATTTIVVGDRVVVQGTVSGTTVTASTVVDQAVKPGNVNDQLKKAPKGFFKNIGQFFMNIFGF